MVFVYFFKVFSIFSVDQAAIIPKLENVIVIARIKNISFKVLGIIPAPKPEKVNPIPKNIPDTYCPGNSTAMPLAKNIISKKCRDVNHTNSKS